MIEVQTKENQQKEILYNWITGEYTQNGIAIPPEQIDLESRLSCEALSECIKNFNT